jgi:threonine/homoserine/homoserine lactone efflux protein
MAADIKVLLVSASADAPSKVLAFVTLGSLFNLTGTLWNLGVAWSAARIVSAGKGIGRIRIWLEQALGAMLVVMGARLALVER